MPMFSVVTPVYDPPLYALREMVQSVRTQTFSDWQLVLVDDASPSPAVRDVLRREAALDPRIIVLERESNGHIVVATNDALASATGEWVVFVDHDDVLVDIALERVADAIKTHPDADYIYTDEDKLFPSGEFGMAFAKPDWSPERLRGQMYTSHLSVVRRSLIDELGGLREGYEGSQDHELVLRVSEHAREVVHVPEVLYHWRIVAGSAAGEVQAKPYAWLAGQRAVQDHLTRMHVEALVELGPVPGTYRIVRHLRDDRKVSIIIPTAGAYGLVWGVRRCFVVEAVRSVLAKTTHDNLEIVVVYDASTPASVLEEVRGLAEHRLVLVPFLEPFHFSRKINMGFLRSSGDYVVLMNDDIEVREKAWLEQLVAPLEEHDIGMTGAKLYFSDGTIQHAGHRYAAGHYRHVFAHSSGDDPGPFCALVVNRESAGVTAAVAALRRDVYDAVGGLSEVFSNNFNDVDLSYKVRNAGLRVVWIANSELYHFESRTRERGVERWERDAVQLRWGEPELDPYLPVLAGDDT